MSDQTEVVDRPESSPISEPKSEIDVLRDEAEKAEMLVQRLRNKQRDILREHSTLTDRIKEAEEARDTAVTKLKPKTSCWTTKATAGMET
jgi:hypothetical protein